jgi:hypothetical protein
MTRPRADVGKAQSPQHPPNGRLVAVHLEALLDHLGQVGAPPADQVGPLRFRALLDPLPQLLLLRQGQLRRPTGRFPVDEILWPVRIEPVDPVPQRLTVHQANRRGLGAALAIGNRCHRHQSPGLRTVLSLARQPAQVIGTVILA